MAVMTRTARRMFELLEPICLVTFFADECNEDLAALGHRTDWDGYFAAPRRAAGAGPGAGRARGLLQLADGEAARHIPRAWETIPPEASIAARERGSTPPYGGSSATSWPTPRAWCAPPT